MDERPLRDLGSKEIVAAARKAQRSRDDNLVRLAEHELALRASQGAKKALETVRDLRTSFGESTPKASPMVNARAPCLYAIKLRANPKKAAYYVGMSTVHSAQCKASIHLRGICVCGATEFPNPYQRSRVPEEHGIALELAREMPGEIDVDALVKEEENWAKELAKQRRVVVWCNGRAFGA